MKGSSAWGAHTAVKAMNSPITMITHPATIVNTCRFRIAEMEVAVAPRATNTALNPSTNNAVMPTTRFIETSPSESSCIEYPDIREM